MKQSSDVVDRLLARGRLGGPERERILERVLADAAPARSGAAMWRWVGLALLPAAAALILVTPRLAGPVFRAKGRPLSALTIELHCVAGSLTACPAGSTLLFAAAHAPVGARLAAYADPQGAGERIWYFSADTEMPVISSSTETTAVASRGIRVGPEHLPGAYRVRVLILSAPAARQEIASAHPPGLIGEARFFLQVPRW